MGFAFEREYKIQLGYPNLTKNSKGSKALFERVWVANTIIASKHHGAEWSIPVLLDKEPHMKGIKLICYNLFRKVVGNKA